MKMTGIHECALQITIAKMVDAGEEEYTGGLREILSLVRGLADGSLRCADSNRLELTERVVAAALLWRDSDDPVAYGDDDALCDAVDAYRNFRPLTPPSVPVSASPSGGD